MITKTKVSAEKADTYKQNNQHENAHLEYTRAIRYGNKIILSDLFSRKEKSSMQQYVNKWNRFIKKYETKTKTMVG